LVTELELTSGPGVLISVGYIDPGNWATDIEGIHSTLFISKTGGSVYEYKLIWVLFCSNFIAILLQTLSGFKFQILTQNISKVKKNKFNLKTWTCYRKRFSRTVQKFLSKILYNNFVDFG
jgi:NRAMP (natural resistance-associated macrophage protein)-like metal ion transporter